MRRRQLPIPETSLHQALKRRYAGPAGTIEVPIPHTRWIVDAITAGGEIIEVQTGSFAPLEAKVQQLVRERPVRIIHPIVVHKRIDCADSTGIRCSNRISPRKGTPWDVFSALIHTPELPRLPNLTIEIVPVDITEERIQDGKGSWRRHGVSVIDRLLERVYEPIRLAAPDAYRRFIPFGPDEALTAPLLARRAGIPPPVARKTLYVLSRLGLVTRTGKQGRAWAYCLETTGAS